MVQRRLAGPSHMRACAGSRFSVCHVVMAKMGRPSTYSEDVAKEICERIADGESLLQICGPDRDERFPDRRTIRAWRSQHPDFEAMYARAKQAQADYYADAILAEAYGADESRIQTARVRIDALKWQAAKLNPARWADNVRLTGAQGDGPVQVDVTAKSALVDGLLAAIAKPEAQD